MFSNRFNSTKKDPLVEAVQSAMQDGEIRRQAEALVNEEFGVYSRKAVVREDLAAYDARLEEAYKCMKEGETLSPKQKKMAAVAGDPKKIDAPDLAALRAGKKMNEKKMYEAEKADKDYDKDGKVESPKDEVWGSRFRAAKMAGKMEEKKSCYEEEQVEEGRTTGNRSYKGSPDRKRKAVQMALGRKHKDHPDWNERTSPQYSALKLGRKLQKQGVTEEEQIDELKKPTAKTAMQAYRRAETHDDEMGDWNRSNRLYRWKQKNLPGKSARNQKPTGKADLPDVSNSDYANDKTYRKYHFTKKNKLTKSATKDTKADIKSRLGKHTKPNLPEGYELDEAAYSAKAARAGKDIGKPGKMFSKIASKAGAKYGSEERGKKVAGAILKRIRAKHMREERIDEIVVQKSQMKPGETLGMAMNRLTGKTAVKGGANDPTSANFKGPKPSTASPVTTSPKMSASTYDRDGGSYADPGKMDYSKSNAGTPIKSEPPKPAEKPASASTYGMDTTKTDYQQNPDQKNVSWKDTGSSSASVSAPVTSKNKEAGSVPKTVAESVQVGDYKYRIV